MRHSNFLKILAFLPIVALSIYIASYYMTNDKDSFNASYDTYAADSEEITNSQSVLGSYSTEYPEKSKGRAHNLKLASSKVNGKILASNEVFSYNETVGPTGKSAGFKKARIFVRGKDAEGYGGGVCQVSSTLYNAVIAAGLEVTERHPHSKRVYYVPENLDAATSYGGIDFKFKNNTENTVKISAAAENGKITVSIAKVNGD